MLTITMSILAFISNISDVIINLDTHVKKLNRAGWVG